MIELDGSSLTLDALERIARGREAVRVSRDAAARVNAARAIVDRHAASGIPVYGVNTGFGALADVAIPADQLAALQLNLLRSHAAGVGDPLPVDSVRALMALRANVLAKGFSGIRLETLETLIALLNAGVHARVPARGSVGASGDLAPLAHLALVLIGEGEVLDDDDDEDRNRGDRREIHEPEETLRSRRARRRCAGRHGRGRPHPARCLPARRGRRSPPAARSSALIQ
jgi:histidine ammonia-lyase